MTPDDYLSPLPSPLPPPSSSSYSFSSSSSPSLKGLLTFISCVSVFCLHEFMSSLSCLVAADARRGHWIPWNWSDRCLWAISGWWKWSSGPLQEEQVLLIAQSSLQHFLHSLSWLKCSPLTSVPNRNNISIQEVEVGRMELLWCGLSNIYEYSGMSLGVILLLHFPPLNSSIWFYAGLSRVKFLATALIYGCGFHLMKWMGLKPSQVLVGDSHKLRGTIALLP